MQRRDFLKVAAGAAATAATSGLGWASEIPGDVKITRAVGFELTSERGKLVGRNSRGGVHGYESRERMVRLFTNTGTEGFGNCWAGKEQVGKLLGKDPFGFFEPGKRRMTGPLGAGTMPLWDLAGRILGRGAYELMGGAGARKVGVYDGSIYFADLLWGNEGNWPDRFRWEIDTSFAQGYRRLKVKVGRGAKWMPKEAGYRRDVEVLKVIRKHCGPDIAIGIDANDGYDLAQTKRLLGELADFDFAFVEEMFPETVDECLELKRFIAQAGSKALLADGETQSKLEGFRPFIEAKAIDVLQGDMNHFGFEGILTEAEWAKPAGILVGPHNWGSLMGYYKQLHIARAITNFFLAERDPLFSDVIIADGYTLKDGEATVPDAPGFGLAIDEKAFAAEVKVLFDLKA